MAFHRHLEQLRSGGMKDFMLPLSTFRPEKLRFLVSIIGPELDNSLLEHILRLNASLDALLDYLSQLIWLIYY